MVEMDSSAYLNISHSNRETISDDNDGFRMALEESPLEGNARMYCCSVCKPHTVMSDMIWLHLQLLEILCHLT